MVLPGWAVQSGRHRPARRYPATRRTQRQIKPASRSSTLQRSPVCIWDANPDGKQSREADIDRDITAFFVFANFSK